VKIKCFFHLAIILLLCIIPINIIAQSNVVHISGRVTDAVTAAELSDVKIYITDINQGTTDSTLTNLSGFWEYDLIVTSIEQNQNLPNQFSVTQNYPNPFNPSTTLDIFVPKAGVVKVKIFNTLGQTIESYKEYLTRGAYSIKWDARGNAGIYFVNIKTKNESITRKMTLLDGGQGKGLSGFQSGTNIGQENSLQSQIFSTIPVRIQSSKFGYVPDTMETVVAGGEYFEISIETIHSVSTLTDLHNDILEKMIDDPNYHLADFHTYNHTDIPRLITGGVDVQFFAVWANPSTYGQNSYNRALAIINVFNFEISLNPTSIGQARTKAEALLLNNQNKIAAVLAVEGGHAIEDDIQKLKALYQNGMRYLTITWNNSTNWAVSAQDSRSTTVGLSAFGEQVIRTLDTMGVMIDVSHTGIKTIQDILSITTNPIIASHSGVRTLRDHYRNLYDDQIISIANTGGVIGIVFYPPFLSGTGSANIARVADHIDYIVNLVGIDHVGLGSDFDGIGTNTVIGLEDVTKFPDLTLELLSRGFSRTDVEKILGGNFIRVFEQVCGQ
jgi:membrane dipeptidase